MINFTIQWVIHFYRYDKNFLKVFHNLFIPKNPSLFTFYSPIYAIPIFDFAGKLIKSISVIPKFIIIFILPKMLSL